VDSTLEQTLGTSPVAQEFLARRRARTSLLDWCLINGFVPARHHKLYLDVLEGATRGQSRRVIISAPRGSAKSTYASDLFPPWFIEQRPNSEIAVCSHNMTLASKFARRSRNRVALNDKVLTYQLAADSRSVEYWETTNGCKFGCFGIGGSVLGIRADLAIIEDPYGSKEEAYSREAREKVWDWWEFDMRPTLKPNASVIVISSRYHDQDFVGTLLEKEGTEWTYIRIPLFAEANDPVGRQPGELLWPEYFTASMVADAQKNQDVLSSQYQQNPTPESGNFFHVEHLHTYLPHELPKTGSHYLASDHALSEREESDSDVLLVARVDHNDNIYILPDLFWKNKVLTIDFDEEAFRMLRLYSPLAWMAGKDHITGALKPYWMRRMQQERLFVFFDEIPHGNRRKRERAQSIRAWMQQGKVLFPSTASWWPAAKTQLLKFDKSDEDDFVDALSCLGQGLDSMFSGSKPRIETPLDKPRELTLDWLKNSDKWKRRQSQLVLRDN